MIVIFGMFYFRCVVDALSLGCALAVGSSDGFRGGKWADAVVDAASAAAGFPHLLIVLMNLCDELLGGASLIFP